MIDALKSDEIVDKLGGRFKLTALIQRRLVEIIDGARPLVDREGRSDIELVIEEIVQNKINKMLTYQKKCKILFVAFFDNQY